MRLEEFFRKYARNYGVGVAEEVRKEIIAISSKPYPPASKPGQAPRKRTGNFVAKVRIVRTTNGARLVCWAPYSGFLQHGTKFMRPRPFLDIARKNVLKRRGIK